MHWAAAQQCSLRLFFKQMILSELLICYSLKDWQMTVTASEQESSNIFLKAVLMFLIFGFKVLVLWMRSLESNIHLHLDWSVRVKVMGRGFGLEVFTDFQGFLCVNTCIYLGPTVFGTSNLQAFCSVCTWSMFLMLLTIVWRVKQQLVHNGYV